MAQPIPRWLMEKYALLFRERKTHDFNFKDAMKIVHEEDKVFMGIILSELRKSGWLTVRFDPEDARKRIYNLVLPEEVIQKIEVENVKVPPKKR